VHHIQKLLQFRFFGDLSSKAIRYPINFDNNVSDSLYASVAYLRNLVPLFPIYVSGGGWHHVALYAIQHIFDGDRSISGVSVPSGVEVVLHPKGYMHQIAYPSWVSTHECGYPREPLAITRYAWHETHVLTLRCPIIAPHMLRAP